jgi:hypothetical protein
MIFVDGLICKSVSQETAREREEETDASEVPNDSNFQICSFKAAEYLDSTRI